MFNDSQRHTVLSQYLDYFATTTSYSYKCFFYKIRPSSRKSNYTMNKSNYLKSSTYTFHLNPLGVSLFLFCYLKLDNYKVQRHLSFLLKIKITILDIFYISLSLFLSHSLFLCHSLFLSVTLSFSLSLTLSLSLPSSFYLSL
jgi:hypothetical protein